MGRKINRSPEGLAAERARKAADRKAKPWVRFVEFARRRCACTDPDKWWPYYGAKGVTCDLTAAELEAVWIRDKAHLLKKPSLDRKDPDGNYTAFNVRFIEFNFNSRLAWDQAAMDAVTPEFT